MELSLIKGNVEIQRHIDRTTSEDLSDDVCVGWHRSVPNGDSVQRLKRMYQAKRFAILLEDAEPTAVVRGGRWLVDTRSPFVFNDLDDFVENASGDRS